MNIYTTLTPLIQEKLQKISINSKLLNEYLLLIEKYVKNPPEDNYEKHHILPKTTFPEFSNLKQNKWNSVNLPYSVHLEAHRLLSLFIDCYKLKFAYYSMINKFKDEYGDISEEEYIAAKEFNREHFTVKDEDGNMFFIHKSDTRYISGELVHNTTGQIVVKDENGNTSVTTKDDPRYISGELKGVTTGYVAVKDKNGNTTNVSKDDPRYISGELVPIATGMVLVRDENGNTLRVSKDDPRYISGELTYILKNKVTVIDKDGNTYSVDIDDPRYISGELKGVTTGKMPARNVITGEIECVYTNDVRLKTGEMTSVTKGRKFYNNGKISKQFYPDKIPEGWKLGRIKKS